MGGTLFIYTEKSERLSKRKIVCWQPHYSDIESRIAEKISVTVNDETWGSDHYPIYSFLEKKDVLASFLDVQGSFDNINTDILLSKLAEIGCSEAIVRFIQFLTHERYIYTDTTTQNFRVVYKGVPQGGVLSPLLYILYVANVTTNLQKTVQSSQFADDLALYIKCRSIKRGKRI